MKNKIIKTVFLFIITILIMLIASECNGQVFHSNRLGLEFQDTSEILSMRTTFEFSKKSMRMQIFYEKSVDKYSNLIYSDEPYGFSVEVEDALYQFYMNDRDKIFKVVEKPFLGSVRDRIYYFKSEEKTRKIKRV